MTSNCLSTLDFIVNQRHPDSSSTPTGGTDNGGNPGDTHPIPDGSSTPNRSSLGSTASKKLFTTAGENEAENSELERVFVSTDGVLFENQADDIRSSLGDLKTVWSQETISITPKKHSNGFAELLKKVRDFKANSHNDVEGERNSITEEAGVNDHEYGKHDINLTEIMKKLAEFRSEITILRDTVESERNGNLVLRHDIEVHKQELLRQIEVQKTIIERQQETIQQKELEACKKECEQSDDNTREANVRESIEAARDAQIAQYREEVTNLQKFFDERIQEMSSERKTYNQTVQELNTKLLEYENEITRLRNEMETERKHIQGPQSSDKYGREDSQESITRTNHESDDHKSNQILNERTERFETSDFTPTLLYSSNKGHKNNKERNTSDTYEVHSSEVDDGCILEPDEDMDSRELCKPPSDMIDNISEKTTTAFREKAFTPGNILRKDYSHPHLVKDEYSDHEISKIDEDARDSPREYGYDNFGYQDVQDTQTRFPSESELEEMLNDGDETVKVSKIPEKNFSGAHHLLDTMVNQHLMHDQDTRHVWGHVTNTHVTVDPAKHIRSYNANMLTVNAPNNLTIFPRMHGPLDVIQEESTPSSPDNIDPDVSNASYRRDKQQKPCDPHLKKDGEMLPSKLVGRSCTEQNAQHFPSHVSNEHLKDLDSNGWAYRVHRSASDSKKLACDVAEAYNTHADNDMHHVSPDDSTVKVLRKEIDELRKDFKKCFQTKPNDQMSVKEVTDAAIENLKTEIQTLKKVFEKDEDKNKTYPVTEDDKLIECLRNEVQQLKKNLEEIEVSKPPVQPNYEDIIDTVRKEIETMKMEQEKNKNESNITTAEDMAVVIELLKQEIQSIKNDPEKGHDRGSNTLIYEDIIRRLQDDIETLKGENKKPLCKLNTSTNTDDNLAMGSVLENTETFMTSQKERQDLEKTASLIEADLKTLKSDFDMMKKEQNQIGDRDKAEMYDLEINALRKEIDAIKTATRNVEQESLQQGISTEMDSIKKEFSALREQQDKIRYQTEISPVQSYPPNIDLFDTMRQEIETIKDTLEKLIETGFNPSQTNQEVTRTNELEAKQQEKYQLKEISATNTDYDQIIDSFRNDIDQLKEDQMKRRDTEMASTLEAKINALIKDMEHMKLEQEKIIIMNEEQENQRHLDGTYIGVIRKEMDGLKRDQEKLKQSLEGRQDYSPILYENIDTLRKDVDTLKMDKQSLERKKEYSLTPSEDSIDTLRKDVDTLKMEKQSLEGRKDYSLTPYEDSIDTLRKDVDTLKMEKQSLEGRKDYFLTPYEDSIDTLRKDVDTLKMEKESLEGRKDYSLTPYEDSIDTLRKDVDALKMEKESLEGRKDYSLTPDEDSIDTLRKDVDTLKMDKQSLEERKDYSLTPYEDIIDTLRKDVDTLKMDKQSLEGRKDYSLTPYEDSIDTLRKDVDTLKMEKESLEGRKDYSLTPYEDIIDTLRKDVDTLKMEKQSLEGRKDYSLTPDEDIINTLRKDVDTLKMEKQSLEGRKDYSLTPDEDSIDTLRKDVDTLKMEKQSLEGRKDYSLAPYEDIDTFQKNVDTLKMEKQSLERRKDYNFTPYEDIIDTLRKDVDTLKMDKQSLEGRKDYSLTPYEDIIDTLRKDVDTLKMDKQSLEGRKDYSLTPYEDIIDTLRKDVDTLKMEKESLEGRKDYSLTPYEDIIDTLRKDVDTLKMEKESLEGRKDYSLTPYEDIIDTLRKDVDTLKMEKESLEGRKDYSLTPYEDSIDTLRKDVDTLKMDKQSLEGRKDYFLTPYEDIIDTLRKDVDTLKMEKQSLEGRKDYFLTPYEDIDALRKDVDALKMEKQLQSNEDRCMLEALRSEVDSLRKLQEQVQYQETDSSTLTPGPSDLDEPALDIKEGMNKEYILRDAFDQLCYECKQRDEEIEACKEDIKKLFELLQNSLSRVDSERQIHVETINEKLAKYSESINKVLTVTKMQSENIEKLVDDTENEKMELRAEVDKYRSLVEGTTLELQQEVESLKKSYEQVFTLQQEIENLRTHTEEMDASTRNKLQEMSDLDNDILLRLENINAAQEDQTKKIASLSETLGQYSSEFPILHKAMETEREEILDIQRSLQKHTQELREDLNNQLTALEAHRKEVETKTDTIQAELQELHKLNVQQLKLRQRRQVIELQDPVIKETISSINIPSKTTVPAKTTVKDLGSLAADDELFERGLQRRANVKELEVIPTIYENIETQDIEERSTTSSWFGAVTTRQRRKAKSKRCLGYLGRICCTALPLILLLLLFLIFALFVPFFHECCTWTNTYRHSPMYFRYVDGPPPV